MELALSVKQNWRFAVSGVSGMDYALRGRCSPQKLQYLFKDLTALAERLGFNTAGWELVMGNEAREQQFLLGTRAAFDSGEFSTTYHPFGGVLGMTARNARHVLFMQRKVLVAVLTNRQSSVV